jgi:4-hydroxy-tetrahydrodipicolinate synthase
MSELKLSGVCPPLPSPTKPDGSINVPMLRRIINYVITNGAKGVVPLGGVGEFNSLSAADRLKVVETTIDEVNGRVPVVAGVVQTSLYDAVESAKLFKAAGANAVLTLPPYYQKPTQEGVREYFKKLRGLADIPLIVYDTPDNTHLIINPSTVLGMVEDGSLAAIKASNSSIDHFNRLVSLLKGRIPLMAGETPFFAVFLAMGADGGFIGNSCFMPRYFVQMYELVQQNKLSEALAAHRKLLGLVDALLAAGYSSAFKQAMSLVGLDCGDPLLPLRPVTPEAFARVKAEFEKLKADGTLNEILPA